MKDLYSLSLNDIAPQNIAQDQQVSSLITAIDPELQELSRASLEPLILARIDELPETIIDLLAWQLHTDFYDLAGTLDMKRQAVKNSILWHMHKGTVWAIKEALRQVDISAEFVHWHDTGGIPYTFDLSAIVTGDFYRTKGKDKLQASIRRAVEESKAARSLMSSLDIHIDFKELTNLYAGIAPLLSGEYRLGLDKPSPPDINRLWAGIGTGLQGEQRILLAHEPDITTKLYAAPITIENRDVALGVDLDTMQELLLQFEKRIIGRIDTYEQNILADFQAKQASINARLDDILDMLRWKGDDEEL